MTVCPVCDLQVEDGEALEQGLVTEYEGMFYYFCSQPCKNLFEKEPSRYLREQYQPYQIVEVKPER